MRVENEKSIGNTTECERVVQSMVNVKKSFQSKMESFQCFTSQCDTKGFFLVFQFSFYPSSWGNCIVNAFTTCHQFDAECTYGSRDYMELENYGILCAAVFRVAYNNVFLMAEPRINKPKWTTGWSNNTSAKEKQSKAKEKKLKQKKKK